MTSLYNVKKIVINGNEVTKVAKHYNKNMLDGCKVNTAVTIQAVEEAIEKNKIDCDFEFNKKHETNITYDELIVKEIDKDSRLCLDNTYKDIINSFINKENKITKEEYHIYVDIMIRLLYLDCDRFIKTVDMDLINNDDLMRVIIVLESMGKYKYIINIIEKMKNIKDVNIIGYYLNALYFTNKRNKLYSVYKYYTNNGMDLSNYEYLINLKQ